MAGSTSSLLGAWPPGVAHPVVVTQPKLSPGDSILTTRGSHRVWHKQAEPVSGLGELADSFWIQGFARSQ